MPSVTNLCVNSVTKLHEKYLWVVKKKHMKSFAVSEEVAVTLLAKTTSSRNDINIYEYIYVG